MEVSLTSKGKPSAHFNGFAYRKFRESKQGVVTWTCLSEKTKNCKGFMRTKNEEVLFVSEHICGAPDEAVLEVRKQVQVCMKRAREETTQLSEIYTEEMGTLHNRGYDFVTKMPRIQSLKRAMRIQRSNARGDQREPKTCSEIVLTEELLKMRDGSSFLLADDGVGERIIIFSGGKDKECLETSSQFFIDGTFKSCSKQFSQIYTIHADLGGPEDETNVCAVAFALLPNKKKSTYIRMFQLIKKNVPRWCPKNVNVDFESAAISALREVFPFCEIGGCYFHMKQCLWRRVQHLGLTEEYRTDQEIRLHISMCAALAFLKPDDVSDGWLEIHAKAPENKKLEEFFEYFVDNWLESHEMPVEVWNCHGRKHRTTNAVEGWHNKINSLIGNSHPRVQTLIKCLKNEAEHSNHMVKTLELNLKGNKKKRVYRELDERINNTVKKYERTGNIRSCLIAISYIKNLN